MNDVTTWKDVLQQNQPRYLDELVELLRIPSISTAEASVGDVKRAADWVARRLTRAGMEHVEVLPTNEHACVYGDWLHAPGRPTILLYGHFDVQPADPLELWESPPFDPVIKDGRIYARGAADMKGNLLIAVIAVEALLAANRRLPVNVKFLFEGQEEIGSRDLGPFIAANRERLACDMILTPDGAQWAEDQPAMWMGIKGACALQIDVETAALDLHSGVFGGAVPNATHALVELLSTLRDREGRILVDGFFDQVVPLSHDERQAIGAVPFDADAYKTEIGIDSLVGEPGYSTYERAWARPTLEVNGVWGGYQGDGVKTVIPAKAHAKITCRLVPNQDPNEVLSRIEDHVQRHRPAGARVAFTRFGIKARPYQLPRDHPGVKAVAEELAAFYQRAPYFVRIGGSLPITDLFLQELNAYTVMVGFAQLDERFHSPNEFLRLADYERGQIVYARLLERLGQLPAGSLSRTRAVDDSRHG
jgi:acetylornithine deacetylase/succinyl-diaminopimelate desuccinylase-like protein